MANGTRNPRRSQRRHVSPVRSLASESTESLKELNFKLKGLMSRNKTLEDENQYLFALISKIQNGTQSEIDSALATYNDEISNLRIFLSEEKKSREELALKADTLDGVIKEREENLKSLQIQLNNAENKNKTLVYENSNLKNQIESEKGISEEFFKKVEMLNAELTKVNSTCLDLRDKYEKEKLKTIDLSSKLQVQEDAKTFFQTLHSQSVAYQKETAAAISSKYKSSVENSLVSQQNSHGSLEGNEADVYEHVSRLVHEYKENAEQAKSQMIDAHQKEVKGLTKLLNDKEDYIEDLNIEMQSMKNQLNEFKASQEENLHLKEKVSKLSEKNLKLMEEKHDTVQEMNEILHINTELQHDISASKLLINVDDSRLNNLELSTAKRYCFENNRNLISNNETHMGPIKIKSVSEKGDYLELSNVYEETISLNGLKLIQSNAKSSIEFKFNEDESVPANGVLRVEKSKDRNLLKLNGSLKTQLFDESDNLASELMLSKVPKSTLECLASYILPKRFIKF